MNTVSGPTRSVTWAMTLSFAPVGVFTQTHSPLRMPRSLAAFGLISMNMFCCSSASHGFERVSSNDVTTDSRGLLYLLDRQRGLDIIESPVYGN